MKKTFMLFFAGSLLLGSCSKNVSDDNTVQTQPTVVPQAVTSAFQARYNASGEIQWEREDANTYKVKFFVGTQRWEAIFKADGTFISERKI